MNGQVKALIPAALGIVALLLTGVAARLDAPGEQQAIQITDAGSVSPAAEPRQHLGTAFRASAEAAALQTGSDIAADLAVELKHAPPIVLAMADGELNQVAAD